MHFECLLYLQSFKSEVVKIHEVALPFLQLSQILKMMLFRINLPAILSPIAKKGLSRIRLCKYLILTTPKIK